MHAASYRTRMTEETFQILFDVMERHFAALRLPDPASDPKITRAISFSELPTSRRILIEQCYQTDDSGKLIRQYSCEQIFDKSSNTREVKVSEIVRADSERCLTNTWKTTLPVFGAVANADWRTGHFGRPTKAIGSACVRGMESMDIEEIDVEPFKHPYAKKKYANVPIVELNGMTLSDGQPDVKPLIRASTFGMMSTGVQLPMIKREIRSRSVSPKKIDDRTNFFDVQRVETFDIVDDNHDKPNYNDIKKNLRSLVPVESTKSTKSRCSCSCFKFIFFIMLALSAIVLGIVFHDPTAGNNDLETDSTWMEKRLYVELNENVYGQKEAIDRLTNRLREDFSGSSLIALVGGTGVGKSYTIGILKKNFRPIDRVFEYTAPLRKISDAVIDRISSHRCNLVILENLRQTDLRDVIYLMKFIRRHVGHDGRIIVMAVFNPEKIDERLEKTLDLNMSIDEITYELRANGMGDATVIGFDTLDDRALDGCIRKAAEMRKSELSNEQFLEIRKTLINAGSGCKGAYAKVHLITSS